MRQNVFFLTACSSLALGYDLLKIVLHPNIVSQAFQPSSQAEAVESLWVPGQIGLYSERVSPATQNYTERSSLKIKINKNCRPERWLGDHEHLQLMLKTWVLSQHIRNFKSHSVSKFSSMESDASFGLQGFQHTHETHTYCQVNIYTQNKCNNY